MPIDLKWLEHQVDLCDSRNVRVIARDLLIGFVKDPNNLELKQLAERFLKNPHMQFNS